MRLKRTVRTAALALSIPAAVAGCATWELRVETGPETDFIQRAAPTSTLPDAFKSSAPYLSLYANTALPPVDGVNPCGDDFFTAQIRERSLEMSVMVNADIANTGNKTYITLYQASQNNSRNCGRKFIGGYIIPWIKIGTTIYQVPSHTIATQKGQENISDFLAASESFIGALGVGGAPILATFDAVLKSPTATYIRDKVNSNLSYGTEVEAGILLIDNAKQDFRDRTITARIMAHKADHNFNPDPNTPPERLGDITLYQRYSRTLIGTDSPQGVSFASAQSANGLKVPMLVGDKATDIFLTALLEMRSSGAFAEVMALRPEDSGTATSSRCARLRGQLPEFNQLDQSAILWLFYRNSPLGRTRHMNTDLSKYMCMSQDEIEALTLLGLPPSTPIN